jgi:O-antigen chain-terminating methyltransferase
MKPISLYEFGGSEELVRQFQKRFVEFFRASAPVLDIGCGRGVFLELLSAAGIEAVGIDHSQESVTSCQEKGFTVHCEEAGEYLQRNPGKFGGIFCSQVIEHMDYDNAIAFLGLCREALRHGGKLLVLTPNPEDLTVISEIFWLDPTHVRPYPLKLLLRMLDTVGFQVVLAKQYPGWRLVGRRHLLGYFFRGMLLGRYFGRPNTMVLARKIVPTKSS